MQDISSETREKALPCVHDDKTVEGNVVEEAAPGVCSGVAASTPISRNTIHLQILELLFWVSSAQK